MMGYSGRALRETGDSVYRALIPRSIMEGDEELKRLIDDKNGTRWVGPGRHIMGYPIRPFQNISSLYNLVFVHPSQLQIPSDNSDTSTIGKEDQRGRIEKEKGEREERERKRVWTTRGSKENLAEEYSGWSSIVTKLISHVVEVSSITQLV